MSEPHKVRVVVAGTLPADFPKEVFKDRAEIVSARTTEELRAAVKDADVLFASRIPDTVPQETPHLRWIQFPSAGIDYAPRRVWESDILLTSSTGTHTVPMTEQAFALLLGLVRHTATFVRAQERHEWVRDQRSQHFTELRGKTMGIIGWGKIGDGIAHVAAAFGMRVIGTRWSLVVPRYVELQGAASYSNPPWLQPVDLPPNVVYPAVQLPEVLAQSDVIVCLLPLTPETHHSFGAREFESMRRGALFLNLGRGPVVDENALAEALRSGRLGGAGLDVFETEPLPASSPLWDLETVIISPHVGGVGDRTWERAAHLFAVNLGRFLEGQELLNVVDRERGY